MANPIIKFVNSVCVQTAVYWGNPSPDGFGGYTYDSPVEIGCRWDGKVQVVTNSQGREVVSIAEVLVTQDLDERGVLWLGALSSLTDDQKADPKLADGSAEILVFSKTPLFRSTDEFVRTAYAGR